VNPDGSNILVTGNNYNDNILTIPHSVGGGWGSIATLFNTPSDVYFVKLQYSPNGEYFVATGNDNSLSGTTTFIKLWKISSLGFVDTLLVSAAHQITEICWFSDNQHFVCLGGSDIKLFERTGDTLTLLQTISITTISGGRNPNTISVTRDTYPLLAFGAGETPNSGQTDGFVAIFKFNPATGLFDTTPIETFDSGTAACFAPDATYPAP
jgi:WD40 repeat protein